ncbi:MAG: MaoC family dehydratase N-terminal domain-containing protein [Sulfobacillus sp.]|nr:MaoC family dehydratase N-terminal domain-containing protein [Sulfobacillus sp.]
MTNLADTVGRRSKPYPTEIERGAIRRFAEAVGETDPIFFEVEAARQHGYRDVVAPPTFAMSLPRHPIPGLKMVAGLIHGEQSFEWGQPICAGDVITVTDWVESVRQRSGKFGTMTLVTLASEGVNQAGERVFRSESVIIWPEGVS